jgi:hypothetical protein
MAKEGGVDKLSMMKERCLSYLSISSSALSNSEFVVSAAGFLMTGEFAVILGSIVSPWGWGGVAWTGEGIAGIVTGIAGGALLGDVGRQGAVVSPTECIS